MEEKYPNWSVYYQEGGQLKIVGYGKRKKIYDRDEALRTAVRFWEYRKGRIDVVLLRYTGLYNCTIDHVIPREEK